MMSSTKLAGIGALKETYRRLKDRIAEAALRAGRKPEHVLMVAVTKTAGPDQIRTLVELGHADLGENRVQQLIQRSAQLEEFLSRKRTLGRSSGKSPEEAVPEVRWHMVGHLQRNKVKQILPLVRLIHSVDSLRLAEEIQTYAARLDTTVDVLLQVNTSGELSKFGVAAPAAIHLAEQIDTMMNVRLRGLMTIAPQTGNQEVIHSTFAYTAEIFNDIRTAKIGSGNFNLLSMGMSDDFELAIAHGANVIRIGRALFGESEN